MSDFILFKGQKRSGNHLLINWILSFYKNPYFKNDCLYDFASGTLGIKNLIKTVEEIKSEHDCYLISIEDVEGITENQISDILKLAKSKLNPKNIISPTIIRDPINWYASHIGKSNLKENDAKFLEFTKKLWSLYRSGLTYYNNSEFKINYNKFIKDVEYRKEICANLNKQFDEAKDKDVINTLWQPAGVWPASSFENEDVLSGKKKAQEMKVEERYKSISSIFQKYPVPADIIDATKNIWPELPIEKINKKFKAL